ncbi:MAG: agmatinase [Acidimicrobiales bacterium]|nr:agmatinase [Acidimicrobiales bacterium]
MSQHLSGPLDGDQAFRRKGLKGPGDEAPYAGALSFLRRNYSREIGDADVVITGFPFDQATSGRPGARFGPRAIREASTGLAELPGYPFGFDPLQELAIADYGDCYLDYGHPMQVVERIEAHAHEILSSGATLISFGGDHFVTYPLLRAHAKKHGPLALIHFDAHSDTWGDDGVRLDHGSMFLRAKREGIIVPERSVQTGIRTPNSSDHGFTVLTTPWVHREGIPAVLEVIREKVGNHPAYVTFDIDCLDPAFAPGTGTPVAGGLSTSQAFDAIRGLTGLNLVGFDVVEVAPAYDLSEITAIAAATIAHDYLCLIAMQKGAAIVPYGRQ